MKFRNTTRGGFPCRVYATDGHPDAPIHYAVYYSGNWYNTTTDADGIRRKGVKDSWDLIPIPELKQDDRVQVRESPEEDWKNRHFMQFNEDGAIRCYSRGRTSWTNETQVATTWKEWRLPEEEAE